jgi:hypothetical protein
MQAITRRPWRYPIGISLFAAVTVSARTADELPTKLYRVTIETGMPHLEENLRYTTTTKTSCLAHQSLAAAFPILSHPALNGCNLVGGQRGAEAISYQLVCSGGHGTTGDAVWQVSEHQARGVLHVRLGGKNMTFYQRLTAVAVGACKT